MLTSTMSWPVLLRTAVCSIAHSSGASRLGLVQRAIQPVLFPDASAWGAAAGAGAGAGAAAGAGAVRALGTWAWPGAAVASTVNRTNSDFTTIFTAPAPT